jgi:alpha-tubulin suppressor-like RCC1 family protein
VAGPQSPDPKATPSLPPETPAKVLHWGSFFGRPNGNFDVETKPVAITLPGPVAEVGSSNSSEYALLKDGRLYAWGLGNDGQLGNGKQRDSFRQAVQVSFPAGVRIAWIPTDAMPYNTGLAVDTKGNVWGWGKNNFGQLCTRRTEILTPTRLPVGAVSALAGASNHVLYDSHGTVYTCGQNIDGDLGDGKWVNSAKPRKVAGLSGTTAVGVYASFANSGVLLSTGQYYDWGYNDAGQLGNGKTKRSNVPVLVHLPSPVTSVALGGSIWDNGQTIVKLSDGSMWAWGNDKAGQLGDARMIRSLVPTRFTPPKGVTYAMLATGSATSYAITRAGLVYAWGISHVGQVGNASTDGTFVPVLVARGATGISSTANNVVINTPDD